MNAIPKIYNEQTNEWIELMAKPIAEEVINIMKEDFMRNKEDIKLSEISYGNEDEFRYYIAYQSNVNQSAIFSLEGTLPFILNEILNKKIITLHYQIQMYYSTLMHYLLSSR